MKLLPTVRRLQEPFRKYVPGLFVLGKFLSLMFSGRSYLRKAGYHRSVATKRPVRADGSPIPFMNYSIIDFLDERLNRSLALFEYGSGNSTLFFAARVGSVVSVESDPRWYEEVSKNMPDNVKLVLGDPDDAENTPPRSSSRRDASMSSSLMAFIRGSVVWRRRPDV